MLNENKRGSNLGTEKPQIGQARCSLKSSSVFVVKFWTMTSPPVSFKPTSKESTKRLR